MTIGGTVNMDGTGLFVTVAFNFIGQMNGIAVDAGPLVTGVLTPHAVGPERAPALNFLSLSSHWAFSS